MMSLKCSCVTSVSVKHTKLLRRLCRLLHDPVSELYLYRAGFYDDWLKVNWNGFGRKWLTSVRGPDRNHETPRSGFRCPGRDSNLTSMGYKSGALPLCYLLGKEVGVSVARSTVIIEIPGFSLNRTVHCCGFGSVLFL
jgi:hypothetical protein